MDNEARKKRLRIKGKLILLGLAAVLFSGLGLGAGLGFGSGGNLNDPAAQKQPEQQDRIDAGSTAHVYETPGASQNEESERTIVIEEETIIFKDRVYSLESLREILLNEYTGEEVYELWDNHAIKAHYDAIRAMLDDLNINYIEK